MLVNMIVVLGLYSFAGQSGVLSFGHISFMALGAYVAALFTMPTATKTFQLPHLGAFLTHAELGTVPAALLAAVLVAAVGYVLAVPLMRLTGLPAGIATFAVLIITYTVLSHWNSVTNGTVPISGIPIDTTLWRTVIWVWVVLFGVFALQCSRVGIRLRAAREDTFAAQAVGVNIAADRRLAFAISAGIVAIAGALYGHLLGTFSPDDFYLNETFLTVAMLVVGGIASMAGAVVGTIVLATVTYVFDQLEAGTTLGPIHVTAPTGSAEIVLAGVLLAILLFRPDGLTGGREFPLPARWSRRRPREESVPGTAPAESTGAETGNLSSARVSNTE